jgi:hypothetical protein
MWWAFRTKDPAEVVKHLELKDTRTCSFSDGVRAVTATATEETMFVTRAHDGWVLAFGVWPEDVLVLELRLNLASIDLGEAQAFVSDEKRRAWLRAKDGELGRCMVFDGEGYPFTRGTRSDGEPLFPQLLATPSDADVQKMARAWSLDPRQLDGDGIVGKRDLAIELPAEEGEDADAFITRVGAHYLQNSRNWERAPYNGPVMVPTPGIFSIETPLNWGKPGPGPESSIVWELPDAMVAVQAMGGLKSHPPTAEDWINQRRQMLTDVGKGWLVIGGQRPLHRAGWAVETCEASAVEPRIVRATRWLFAPPLLLSVSLSCSDAIPHARGREMVFAFNSLRPTR